MTSLASTYECLERWDDAIMLKEAVLEVYKSILGEQDPDTVKLMANLASVYQNQGHRGEGVGSHEAEVLEAQGTGLGER
jgi:Tetratricopeptide repeat